MRERLTKSDWLRHGLRTLASDGANALKVGPMAATLGVSRGSFYWHFKDIADFRAQVLRRWQERSTDQVIRQLDDEQDKPDRIDDLMKRAFDSDRSLDRAIRAWATEDGDVAEVVASVDAERIDYIAKLLAASGVGSRKALPRAAFLYWAYLGHAIDMDPRRSSLAASAMDDVSGLFKH